MKLVEKMKCVVTMILVGGVMLVFSTSSFAQEVVKESEGESKSEVVTPSYTVAVLPFEASGNELKDVAPEVSLLMNTCLSGKDGIALVERDKLDKAISEMEIGISGTVDPQIAAQIGQITGAKILITGRVFVVQNELFLVAKIIGSETSQVFAETVSISFKESHADATKQLAQKVARTIAAKGETLIAKKKQTHDSLEDLKYMLEGRENLPVISVAIIERHVSQLTLDPAAETEINMTLASVGFPIVDPNTTVEQPDIEITGEAFSEFGMRNGNLVSTKARVEVKVIERTTGKILAVDRETGVAVDLSEQIAGKTAIQEAAKKIAIRIIPKIVDSMEDSKVFVSE